MLILQVMEVKGQMIHNFESNSILFLGSPCVDKLDELYGTEGYISQTSLSTWCYSRCHLAGWAAKAQDGLKKMDKLKATLERTHQPLKKRKRKQWIFYTPFSWWCSPAIVARAASAGQKVWWCQHAVFRHCYFT